MALDVVTYVLCRNFTKAQIATVIETLGEGMKFRGSVPTQSALPIGAVNGDLYLIEDQKCKAVRYNNAWLIFDHQPTKTSQLINDSGFVDESALVTLATKAELAAIADTIPSKTSQLVNDSGFLTEAAIEGKADKTALQAEVSERTSVDTTLQTNITNEVNARESAINAVNESINQESIAREQADTTLQNNINLKQDKLTAGENITIDGSTIKAVDTKYTAGENVTITNNVISAIGGKVDDVKLNGESVLEGKIANLDLTSYAKLIDLQIGKSFTTNVTVGHLESGTDIFSTDTLGDLIYRILYKKPVGDVIDLYFGANDNIPSSKDGLTKVADQSIADLLSNGINHNIVCGHGEGAQAVAQYPTVAFAKDLILDKWTTTDFPYPMDFITVDKGTYNIYYLPDASYDTPEGINYHFTFKEA